MFHQIVLGGPSPKYVLINYTCYIMLIVFCNMVHHIGESGMAMGVERLEKCTKFLEKITAFALNLVVAGCLTIITTSHVYKKRRNSKFINIPKWRKCNFSTGPYMT